MKFFGFALVSLFVSGAVNAANLIPGENIRLSVLNGAETKSKVDPVALEDGFNQVVISVSQTVGKGSNERVFDSDPFILMFEAGDQDITIKAPEFQNYERAKKYFKGTPDMKLLSGGKEVDYTYDKLPKRKGFLPFRGKEELVANYNAEHGIAFGEQGKLIAETKSVASVAAATATASAAASNVDQLKGWYLKASKAERKEFRKWMIDME